MGVRNVDLFEIPRAAVPTQEPVAIEGLTRISQFMPNWCWAACALMVYRRKPGTPLQLCDIANKKFNRNDCCQNTLACNLTCNASDIVNVFKLITLTANPFKKVTSTASMAAAIRAEIAANRPVEICYNIDLTGFHVVLIAGITPPAQVPEQFLVLDPAKPTATMSIDSLMTLERTGIWLLYWDGIQ